MEMIGMQQLSEFLTQLIQQTVSFMGVASSDDLKNLEKRVAKLEASVDKLTARKKPGRPPGKKSSKKAAGKKAAR